MIAPATFGAPAGIAFPAVAAPAGGGSDVPASDLLALARSLQALLGGSEDFAIPDEAGLDASAVLDPVAGDGGEMPGTGVPYVVPGGAASPAQLAQALIRSMLAEGRNRAVAQGEESTNNSNSPVVLAAVAAERDTAPVEALQDFSASQAASIESADAPSLNDQLDPDASRDDLAHDQADLGRILSAASVAVETESATAGIESEGRVPEGDGDGVPHRNMRTETERQALALPGVPQLDRSNAETVNQPRVRPGATAENPEFIQAGRQSHANEAGRQSLGDLPATLRPAPQVTPRFAVPAESNLARPGDDGLHSEQSSRRAPLAFGLRLTPAAAPGGTDESGRAAANQPPPSAGPSLVQTRGGPIDAGRTAGPIAQTRNPAPQALVAEAATDPRNANGATNHSAASLSSGSRLPQGAADSVTLPEPARPSSIMLPRLPLRSEAAAQAAGTAQAEAPDAAADNHGFTDSGGAGGGTSHPKGEPAAAAANDAHQVAAAGFQAEFASGAVAGSTGIHTPASVPAAPSQANDAPHAKPGAPQTPHGNEPPPAAPPSGRQEIVVRVELPDHQPVDVRVAQRGGQVQVAVRTPDAQLQGSLRQELSGLVNSLEQSGYHAEAFTPRGHAGGNPATLPNLETAAQALSQPASDAGHQDSNSQGNPNRHHHPSGGQQQQQHQQRRQPQAYWMDALEQLV